MPAFPKGECLLCHSPVPKDRSFCPGTDHYDRYIKGQGKVTALQRTEQKKLAVASRKVTEETFVNIEEKHTATRAEMYFLETQEQVQTLKEQGSKEDWWQHYEKHFATVGAALIPVIMAISVGCDIGVFLWEHSGQANAWLNTPLLLVAIGFEIALASLTYYVRGVLKDKELAAKGNKAIYEARYHKARNGWFFLAAVSAIAQFAAITNGSLEGLTPIILTVLAIRVIGTTCVDGVIALCFAPRVKTPEMLIAEMDQEAEQLEKLAQSQVRLLQAQSTVRKLFYDVQEVQA